MTSLAEKLSDIVGAAFACQGLPVELGAVRVSDRPDLCQFQCNGAMAAAKLAKKNPREVAQGVVEALAGQAELTKVEIAGPGFINIDVSDAFIAGQLAAMQADAHAGVSQSGAGQTVVLDYGGPNIAKPMHVGHLRSSIIGDSLRRTMKVAGYNTIGDVHMGDWGTPMGMILSELEIRHPDWVYFNETHTGGYPSPSDSPITIKDLEEIYPSAAQDCKSDEFRMEQARQATAELQNGRQGYIALWHHFVYVSVMGEGGMEANFRSLGVHFDEWKGEGSVHELIVPMIEDLKEKGCAVESDGAWVVPVERETDKKEVPPLILLKKDGAVLYGTTDLATIIDRVKTHNPDKIVYVVDQRQSLHFDQVFRAAEKGGLVVDGRPELSFAGFGTMNGADGKPFKTRAGGVMKLEDLIAMGVEKARARLEEANLAADMDADEKEIIAHKVALAAIKFADLQNQRQSDYVFDLDRMTSFEGKTGPYLLYQAVRIQSLLRKAGDSEQWTVDGGFKIQNEDRALALLLGEMADHFELALKNYTPHVLCDYAYRLAQEFSSFYGNCHILSEENEAVRASRLALCALTHRQLCLVLSVLGIDVPERM